MLPRLPRFAKNTRGVEAKKPIRFPSLVPWIGVEKKMVLRQSLSLHAKRLAFFN